MTIAETVKLKGLRHYFFFLLVVSVLLSWTTVHQGQSLPTVSSISPTSAPAGGPNFNLTVNGTGFFPGNIVQWSGSNRPTTFVSATQLIAAIPATDLQNSGIYGIGVSGGLGGAGFSVLPAIFSLSPPSAIVGGPSFLLTVNGAGFPSDGGSSILWNGTALTTNYISSNQLTATVSAPLIAATGSAAVTVMDVFEQLSSAPVAFAINNPLPVIGSLSPASAVAGSGALTLTVTGTNFVSASTVRWNGSNRATTFVSSTQLQASISAADVAGTGTANISVINPSPGGGTSGNTSFNITAPRLSLSPNSLDFGAVLIGSPSTRTATVTNLETSSVQINATTTTGSPFTISPPTFTLAGNGSLVVTLTFTPLASARYDALASFLVTAGGESLLSLSGQGVTSLLSFSYSLSGQSPVPITPGGTVVFPATDAGGSASAQFRIVNPGSSVATISTISSSSPTFALSGLSTLPASLPINGSLTFTLTFQPTTAGDFNGTLLVNNFSFTLSGTAVSSPLTYRYTLPNQPPVSISSGGTISLPSVASGGTSSALFEVINPSSGALTVGGISSNNSIFSLSGLPSIPASVPAGGSVAFNIQFKPSAPGSATGILTVGTRTFSLSGTGLATGLTLTGIQDVTPPAEQPKVGVELTSSSSVPLTGQLVLSFASTADVPSDDPAVQFSAGSRVIDFTVPANSTKAQFPGGQPDASFSTGTVAGNIRLTVILKNGADIVTPNPDPSRTVVVDKRAPVITSVSIASRTASGFEVVIVGYSTTRSLNRASFQFVAKSGSAVQNGSATLNVDSLFSTWYQGTDSQQFGSQFRLRVPFTVQGDVNAIGSLSVTLTNATGTSAPASATF